MKTVVILGAGASKPYGFPLGYELVTLILRALDNEIDNFYHWGFDNKLIHDFKDAITRSKPIAIDDLLVQRREFVEIGKLTIASVLTRFENEIYLYKRGIEDDWYEYFFNHVRGLPTPLMENQFSFITFNYDRSLDHFLNRAADSHFENSDPKRMTAIQKIPILHIHGNLGLLPWHGGSLYFAPQTSIDVIHEMGQNLKLTSEELDNDIIAKAQTLIQEADRVRFLGFGYHETNMDRLDFIVNAKNCNDVNGTAYGITDVERGRLVRDYPKLHALDHKNRTMVQFFRESRPLD